MSPALAFAAVALIAWFNQEQPAPPPPDRIVLLPGPDGKVGKVVVNAKGGERLLDSAYAGAEIATTGQIAAVTESEASVRTRFGAALDARPMRPVSFRVHFVSGRDELTADSQPTIAAMKKELTQRPAPEIAVIGHTDRVGGVEANDKLSLRRAEAVKQILMHEGVPATSIDAAGRGEREPLVPTADEVAEPRNRRVEIEVR